MSDVTIKPKARVLVVDDEVSIRSTLAKMLAAVGYSIDVAEGGVEALALAAEHAPTWS